MKILYIFIIVIFLFLFGNIFFQYKINLNGDYQNINQIPSKIKKYALKIEDKRFYQHFGVDFLALLRALKIDLQKGKFVQGASTIDQQVIKLSQKNFKRGVLTKFKEIFLAINLIFNYKKDEILTYWVNNIYFPYNVKGFKQSCKVYFEKDCSKLWDSELLFLFSMYQTGKNPYKNFDLIKIRSKILAKQVGLDTKNWDKLPPVSKNDLKFNKDKLTLQKLLAKNIKLDINQTWESKIDQILENTKDFRQNMGFLDCCVLIMDKNGNINSINVCRDIEQNNWINTCFIKRQTGSVIKPFVYLLAMEKLNYTQKTILEDKKIDYILNGLKKYIPRNFDLKYHGKVSLAVALGNSLNVPAVETLNKLGVKNFLDFIINLRYYFSDNVKNIEKDKQKYNAKKLGLSAALGTYEMSVYEFANIWRVFLQNQDIKLKNGQIVHKKNVENIVKILSDNKNRLISFGLNNVLDKKNWAVKTGTSRNFIDGWTCGVNTKKQIILCVWAGNVNNLAMKGAGSKTAGFLWSLVIDSIDF